MAEVNIGEFDQIVEIFSCATRHGDKGETIEDYSKEGCVSAKVDVLINEEENDYNISSERTITVTTYGIPDMTTRWRLRWQGQNYGIRSITPVSRMSPFTRIVADETR